MAQRRPTIASSAHLAPVPLDRPGSVICVRMVNHPGQGGPTPPVPPTPDPPTRPDSPACSLRRRGAIRRPTRLADYDQAGAATATATVNATSSASSSAAAADPKHAHENANSNEDSKVEGKVEKVSKFREAL